MKQFATWFTHGVPGGAKLRAAIYHSRTGYDVLGEVERFFALHPNEGVGEESYQDEGAPGPSHLGTGEVEEAFPDAALVCD